MARLWSAWASVLVVVSPGTVLRWHRLGFRYYWRWKSHGKPGRKRIDAEARMLIRQMSHDNPTWGTPRIKAELHLLGHDVSKATIDKYRARPRKPPSPSWRAFLKNHVAGLASMDFFVVPTVTFRLLYAFVILRHDRRRIVHLNVTAHPTAAWVAQQLREAFPFDLAPRYLIHDRDGIYGNEVHRCLKSMNIEEVVIAPRSPWQNPYVERLIGTIRRELLAHIIVLNERHLRLLMSKFVRYYHTCRTHRALEQNSPEPREIEARERGKVIAEPHLGGLHHRYRRSA
jgi:transposase InsO family protein